MATFADIINSINQLPVYTADTKVLNWEDKWYWQELKGILSDMAEYMAGREGVVDCPLGSVISFNNNFDPNSATNAAGSRLYPGIWQRIPEGYAIYTGIPSDSGDFAVDNTPGSFKIYGTNEHSVPLVAHYHRYPHTHISPTCGKGGATAYGGTQTSQYYEVGGGLPGYDLKPKLGYAGAKGWDYGNKGDVHTAGASADWLDAPCTSFDIPKSHSALGTTWAVSGGKNRDRLAYIKSYKNEAALFNLNTDAAQKTYLTTSPLNSNGDAMQTASTMDVRQCGIVLVHWVKIGE